MKNTTRLQFITDAVAALDFSALSLSPTDEAALRAGLVYQLSSAPSTYLHKETGALSWTPAARVVALAHGCAAPGLPTPTETAATAWPI
jgi:hypothetical protein